MCVLANKQWSKFDLDVLCFSNRHMLIVIYWESVPETAVPHGQLTRCIAEHPQVFLSGLCCTTSGKDTKYQLEVLIVEHPQMFLSGLCCTTSGKDTKYQLLIKLHFTTNRCYIAWLAWCISNIFFALIFQRRKIYVKIFWNTIRW